MSQGADSLSAAQSKSQTRAAFSFRAGPLKIPELVLLANRDQNGVHTYEFTTKVNVGFLPKFEQRITTRVAVSSATPQKRQIMFDEFITEDLVRNTKRVWALTPGHLNFKDESDKVLNTIVLEKLPAGLSVFDPLSAIFCAAKMLTDSAGASADIAVCGGKDLSLLKFKKTGEHQVVVAALGSEKRTITKYSVEVLKDGQTAFWSPAEIEICHQAGLPVEASVPVPFVGRASFSLQFYESH